MARKKYVRGSDPVFQSQQAHRQGRAQPARSSPRYDEREPIGSGPTIAYGPQREAPRAARPPSSQVVSTRGSSKVHVHRSVLEWARTGRHRDMDVGQLEPISPSRAQRAVDQAIDVGAKLDVGQRRSVRTGAYTVHDYGNREPVHLVVLRSSRDGDIYVDFESEGT